MVWGFGMGVYWVMRVWGWVGWESTDGDLEGLSPWTCGTLGWWLQSGCLYISHLIRATWPYLKF